MPRDWKDNLRTLREALKAAYDKLEPCVVETVNPSRNAPLDYFLALSVYELLQARGEKGMLGGYKGEAGIWQKLVGAYEKRGMFPFLLGDESPLEHLESPVAYT